MSRAKPRYVEVEEVVTRFAETWTSRLGLEHFDIEHVFLDTFDGEEHIDDYKTTAITECRWQYLQARIKWFLPSAVRHDDDHLERVVVHELVHVMLGPEQTLVFDRATLDADGMSSHDADALMAQYSERLELSTELVTRALLRAWLGR